MKDYDDKKFVNITKENITVPLSEDEAKAAEEQKKELEPLCKHIKECLGDVIEKVVVSDRLNDTPCCLVTSEYGWSANGKRIMQAQALGNHPITAGPDGETEQTQKPIMRECSDMMTSRVFADSESRPVANELQSVHPSHCTEQREMPGDSCRPWDALYGQSLRCSGSFCRLEPVFQHHLWQK